MGPLQRYIDNCVIIKMENEVAEEHKAMLPSVKSPLYHGLSHTREHIAKTPFTRYPNPQIHSQVKAAKLHIGMLRSLQDDPSELERMKEELAYLRMRDVEHLQVIYS